GQVYGAAQRATDEPLDLLRSAAGVEPLALYSQVGAAGQQGVLGGQPAGGAVGAAQVARQLILDAHCGQHLRVAPAHQGGALGVQVVTELNAHGAQLVRTAALTHRFAVATAHGCTACPARPDMVALPTARPG